MWARGVAVLNMCVCLVGCTSDSPSSGLDGGAAVADVGAPADDASPTDGADPGGAFGAPGSLEAIGAAGGPYELFHLGTGAIRDFRDGAPMRLPIERRVHLTIMAEGYLATEWSRRSLLALQRGARRMGPPHALRGAHCVRHGIVNIRWTAS